MKTGVSRAYGRSHFKLCRSGACSVTWLEAKLAKGPKAQSLANTYRKNRRFRRNSANYDRQRTGNGCSGYFEYNLNNTLGLVADIGGYANTRTGINDKLLTYMFGPRFNWRHTRLNPYAQFLFGGAYVSNNPAGVSTTQNAFATAAGGGLDYRLTNRIAIKPIQVEYVMTQIDIARGFGSHQNNIRYSAGVVLRFGAK